jgi:hypothetical protein
MTALARYVDLGARRKLGFVSAGAALPLRLVTGAGRQSEPKLHHYVTQAYLARFGRGNVVAVRWRDRPDIYVSNVKGVAAETGFYYTEEPAGRTAQTETWLSGIDHAAHRAIAHILATVDVPGASSPHRLKLSRFLALQLTRTPEVRERLMFAGRVLRYANGRPIDERLVETFLEEEHLGYRPAEPEVKGAYWFVNAALSQPGGPLTQTEAVKISMELGRRNASVIYRKQWSLEVAPAPELITSDAPLVIWRTPTKRDEFEGVGLLTAEEIRFPLDPTHQLLLTDEERPSVVDIDVGRVAACNEDMASACHRFIVGHPDRKAALAELPLASLRPTLRFNVGPGVETAPDGSERPIGEVLHYWTQRSDRGGRPARKKA